MWNSFSKLDRTFHFLLTDLGAIDLILSKYEQSLNVAYVNVPYFCIFWHVLSWNIFFPCNYPNYIFLQSGIFFSISISQYALKKAL